MYRAPVTPSLFGPQVDEAVFFCQREAAVKDCNVYHPVLARDA